jgi:hypothetical protein
MRDVQGHSGRRSIRLAGSTCRKRVYEVENRVLKRSSGSFAHSRKSNGQFSDFLRAHGISYRAALSC